MNTAVEWFARMRIEIEAAQRHRDATRTRLAPDFNAIRFLRKDEYGLSVVLADLLDPKGSHGQGRLFLGRFVEWHWPDGKPDCNDALVRLESPAGAQRRIDIEIRFVDGAVMGIESKLCGALDGDGQIAHYLGHLAKSSASRHRLIYLTPERDELPAQNSIPAQAARQAIADGRLQCLGAGDLADWLRDCIGPCKAERVRAFLGDLIDYLETDLQGIEDMTENELIVQAAVRDADSARDALRIAAAGHRIRENLLIRYADALRRRIASGGLGLPADWYLVIDKDLQKACASISLRPKERASHHLRLSFERSGANCAYIGVSKIEAHHSNDAMTEVHDALVEAFGQERRSDWWPWFRNFDPLHWGDSPETMAALLDESENGMVARTLRGFAGILDVLKTRNLLDKFGTAPSLSIES